MNCLLLFFACYCCPYLLVRSFPTVLSLSLSLSLSLPISLSLSLSLSLLLSKGFHGFGRSERGAWGFPAWPCRHWRYICQVRTTARSFVDRFIKIFERSSKIEQNLPFNFDFKFLHIAFFICMFTYIIQNCLTGLLFLSVYTGPQLFKLNPLCVTIL